MQLFVPLPSLSMLHMIANLVKLHLRLQFAEIWDLHPHNIQNFELWNIVELFVKLFVFLFIYIYIYIQDCLSPSYLLKYLWGQVSITWGLKWSNLCSNHWSLTSELFNVDFGGSRKWSLWNRLNCKFENVVALMVVAIELT